MNQRVNRRVGRGRTVAIFAPALAAAIGMGLLAPTAAAAQDRQYPFHQCEGDSCAAVAPGQVLVVGKVRRTDREMQGRPWRAPESSMKVIVKIAGATITGQVNIDRCAKFDGEDKALRSGDGVSPTPPETRKQQCGQDGAAWAPFTGAHADTVKQGDFEIDAEGGIFRACAEPTERYKTQWNGQWLCTMPING